MSSQKKESRSHSEPDDIVRNGLPLTTYCLQQDSLDPLMLKHRDIAENELQIPCWKTKESCREARRGGLAFEVEDGQPSLPFIEGLAERLLRSSREAVDVAVQQRNQSQQP